MSFSWLLTFVFFTLFCTGLLVAVDVVEQPAVAAGGVAAVLEQLGIDAEAMGEQGADMMEHFKLWLEHIWELIREWMEQAMEKADHYLESLVESIR
jgi:hypothetical protein